ncbi:putative transmembrane protein [Tieghemostelium lacteum]|uniref:Lipase maturation factor 2 n=1 Tax=Tieghemostelium lacteum TaxID=361077 RepID=A0A151ZK52_TIELA|nr:putative transmembrane protein [Tieghemostelium lacteum]|eukprot:KYQ94378.1 putative transmembrane protein [Tieghemostelium lacteum]
MKPIINNNKTNNNNQDENYVKDLVNKNNKLKKFKEKKRKNSYYLSTWIFLKILTTVTFIAFFSSFIQVKGLIGDDGILPVSKVLREKVEQNEINKIWMFFTQDLGISVNNMLHLLCCLGLTFSALSLFTTSHATFLGFMWFCYYCIVDVGQQFYSYQWDQLLLETLFLAIFLSPFNFKYDSRPSTPIRYLYKWLLFRLMFGSGLVKLTPIWSSLQAMYYHYETQCIPNIISWYAHQLPPSIYHQFEAMMVLVMEILVPFCYFATPRFLNISASILTILYQCAIILTGNYNFFNYLTIGLCVLLFDDQFYLVDLQAYLPRFIKQKFLDMETVKNKHSEEQQTESSTSQGLSSINSKNLLVPFVFILIGTSSLYNCSKYFQKQQVPSIITRVHSTLSLYHLTGTYGLFSHVTTERYEIIIEGSMDGENWKEYEFYYKPGNIYNPPPFIFPGHNPRLDWQMWFAALSKDSRTQSWLIHFMAKLLQGSAEVQSLIYHSPFDLESPPLYIRAQKYRYQFSKWTPNPQSISNQNVYQNDKTSQKEPFQWWEREYIGIFVRPFTLQSQSYLNFLKDQ